MTDYKHQVDGQVMPQDKPCLMIIRGWAARCFAARRPGRPTWARAYVRLASTHAPPPTKRNRAPEMQLVSCQLDITPETLQPTPPIAMASHSFSPAPHAAAVALTQFPVKLKTNYRQAQGQRS